VDPGCRTAARREAWSREVLFNDDPFAQWFHFPSKLPAIRSRQNDETSTIDGRIYVFVIRLV
jgi:hypothetical protein